MFQHVPAIIAAVDVVDVVVVVVVVVGGGRIKTKALLLLTINTINTWVLFPNTDCVQYQVVCQFGFTFGLKINNAQIRSPNLVFTMHRISP